MTKQAAVTFRLPPNRASLREHVRVQMTVAGESHPTTFCHHIKSNTYKVAVLGSESIIYIAQEESSGRWAAALCKKVGKRTYTPESAKLHFAKTPEASFLSALPELEALIG